MAQKWLFSTFFLAAAFFGSVNTATAQSTPRSFLWEPEFSVDLPSDNKWGFSFGIANRYLFESRLDGEQINENEQQHFEVNQFTSYKTGENSSVALGFRYRFRETFNDSRHDEFRMIQQFGYKHRGTFLTPAHRFRFEQRFRENTIFRLRYRIGISQPLGEDFAVGLSTEFLYSMIKDFKPEADQRYTIKFENSSIKNLELSAGVELRREDYAGAPTSEIYILSGINLQL
ncbi:MAG: DUF2490 domain-containing protein [Salinimicrobium sediminis]|nr:DUF2490 domain-containing protein [Salinimicrobium sediminis]